MPIRFWSSLFSLWILVWGTLSFVEKIFPSPFEFYSQGFLWSFSDLSFSLFPPSLKFHHFRSIHNGRIVGGAQFVKLDLSLVGVLMGQKRLSNVLLEKPYLSLPQGKISFPSQNHEKSPWLVDRLQIQDGSLGLEFDSQTQISLSGVDSVISGSSSHGSGEIRIQKTKIFKDHHVVLDKGRLFTKFRHQMEAPEKGGLSHPTDLLKIFWEEADWLGPDYHLQGSGEIEVHPHQTSWKGLLSGYAHLGILGRFLEIPGEGKLHGDVQMGGLVPHGEGSHRFFVNMPEAHWEDGKLGDFSLFHGLGNIQLDESKVSFPYVRIWEKNLSSQELVQGQGILDYEKNFFDFQIHKVQGSSSSIMNLLQKETSFPHEIHFQGKDWTLSGQLSPFSMKLRGTGEIADILWSGEEPKTYPIQTSYDLDLSFDLEKAYLGQTKLFLLPKPMKVGGSLHYQEGWDLVIEGFLDEAFFEKFFKSSKVPGSVHLQGSLKGPWEDPQWESHVDLFLQGESLEGKGRGDIFWKKGLWKGKNLFWKGQKGLKFLAGDVLWEDFENMSLKGEIQEASEEFFKLLNSPFRGSLLKAQGEWQHKSQEGWTGNLEILGKNLFWKETLLAESLEAHLLSAKNKTLKLNLQRHLLTLESQFKLEQLENIKRPRLFSSKTPWWTFLGLAEQDELQGEFSLKGHGEKEPWAGDVHFQGEIQGPLKKLFMNLHGQVGPWSYHGAQESPGTIKVQGTLDNLEILAEDSWGSFNLAGRLHEKGYGLKILANSLDLRSWLPAFFWKDPANYLLVSGEGHVEGKWEPFWSSLQGEVSIAKANLRYQSPFSKKDNYKEEWPWDASLASPVTLKIQNLWSFSPILIQGPGLHLALKDLNFHPENFTNGEGEASLEGSLLLDQLQPFLPLDKAQGTLNFSAYTKNRQTKAQLKSLNPLQISFLDISPELKDIELEAQLAKDGRIYLKSQASKGGGLIQLQGYLAGLSEKNNDLQLTFDKVKHTQNVPYLKTLETLLSGKLNLKGKKAPFMITGDWEILKARSWRNFDLRTELVHAFRQKLLEIPTNPDLNHHPWALFDINFHGKESILIVNKNMDMVLSSQLKITGSSSSPTLKGSLSLDRGFINYKRTFKVTQAELAFESSKIDPRINMQAFTDVAPYRINLIVEGLASEPNITFHADPPMKDDGTPLSQVDILMLLTRGTMSASQTEDLQGESLSEAINIYASQLPFDKIYELSGQNPIRPYVDSTTDEKGSPVPQLNVSLNFIKGVDVLVQQTPTKTKLSLQMPIHDHIALYGSQTTYHESSGDNSDQTSLDLKFRFAF